MIATAGKEIKTERAELSYSTLIKDFSDITDFVKMLRELLNDADRNQENLVIEVWRERDQWVNIPH